MIDKTDLPHLPGADEVAVVLQQRGHYFAFPELGSARHHMIGILSPAHTR